MDHQILLGQLFRFPLQIGDLTSLIESPTLCTYQCEAGGWGGEEAGHRAEISSIALARG